MSRKVRHPYQVLEASEMVAGQLYAFVQACRSGNDLVSHYTMGGTIHDSAAAVARLGKVDSSTAAAALSSKPEVEMLLAAPPAGPVVTVHMDGWYHALASPSDFPTLIYWRMRAQGLGGSRMGWDSLSTYLGHLLEATDQRTHCVVVPVRPWLNDDRLHVSDWADPTVVIERDPSMGQPPLDAEDAIGWERRMRARAHDAMAKSLGF